MKKFLIVIFLLVLVTGTLSNNIQNEYKEKTTQNTFLVKTQLTKEQLQTLLQEGETQLINLKKKYHKNKKENNAEEIINYNKTTVDDGDNITTEEGLQREIEDEIMDIHCIL